MILLSSTITFSVAIMPFLYFLAVVTGLLMVVVTNLLLLTTLDKITRYDNRSFPSFNQKQHNMMIYTGILIVPLFKKVIRDARYCSVMIHESKGWDSSAQDTDYDMKTQELKYARAAKLMKLKYKKKNFVKRKVFSIFVDK